MIPRAGEILLLVLAVGMVLAFYRLPAVGDWLGRVFRGKKK